jgi:hypothetical protein
MCQSWWTAEVLPITTVIENARQHSYSAQHVPGFPRYPYGLIVIWSSNRCWAVPVRANGSVCRFDEFEPSDCQWERWQREWQDVADQWRMWVEDQAYMKSYILRKGRYA